MNKCCDLMMYYENEKYVIRDPEGSIKLSSVSFQKSFNLATSLMKRNHIDIEMDDSVLAQVGGVSMRVTKGGF